MVASAIRMWYCYLSKSHLGTKNFVELLIVTVVIIPVHWCFQQAEFAEEEADDDDDDDDQESVLGVISVINLTYNKVIFSYFHTIWGFFLYVIMGPQRLYMCVIKYASK